MTVLSKYELYASKMGNPNNRNLPRRKVRVIPVVEECEWCNKRIKKVHWRAILKQGTVSWFCNKCEPSRRLRLGGRVLSWKQIGQERLD